MIKIYIHINRLIIDEVKMNKILLLQLLLTQLMFSCGSNSGDGSPAIPMKQNQNGVEVNQTFTYQIEVNGCNTGEHTFKSKIAYCEALEDEALNNGCALNERDRLYFANCLEFGEFTPKAAVAEESSPDQVVGPSQSYDVQITALNFLYGGLEPCDVKNKKFTFSSLDNKVKSVICSNHRVELFAISHKGQITFHATDLLYETELLEANYSQGNTLVLGNTNGSRATLRYSANNPYGFTHVTAEEITGLDPVLLEKWNRLNSRLSELREQEILARKNGKKLPKKVQKEIAQLENEMRILDAQMKGN